MNVQNEILEFFGTEATEEMVRDEYKGKSQEEILESLNQMWPKDENEELAEKVYEWLKYE